MATRGAWVRIGFVGIVGAAVIGVACGDDSSGGGPGTSTSSGGASTSSSGVAGSSTTSSSSSGSTTSSSSSGSTTSSSSSGGPDGGPDSGVDAGPTCNATATGYGLTCNEFPAVAPCPHQDILKDATMMTALKAALKLGVVQHYDTPFDAANGEIYKEKCGLEGFWNPANDTDRIPPATPIPELASLFTPTANGHAGICTTYSAADPSTDGFPHAGVYHMQIGAAYQGQTYLLQVRSTVTGTKAGTSFSSNSLSGPTALFYSVNGTTAPEATLWNSIVDAFASSTTSFPNASLDMALTSGGASVWNSKVELVCAMQASAPAAGPGVITVADTISVAGSPLAMAYSSASSKAYVSMTTVNGVNTVNANIAVINDANDTVASTITTTGIIVAMAVNNTTKRLYAAGRDNKISVIDTTADTISTSITTPTTLEALAVDEANNKIYAASGGKIYTVDGSNNTIGASPATLTGIAVNDALTITNGRNNMAYDTTTGKLYVIGLDNSLNGVVQRFTASTMTMDLSTALTGLQPQSVTVVPGIGAIVTVAAQDGNPRGPLLVAENKPPTTFSASAVSTCGTSAIAVGHDAFGNASFSSFTPTATVLGAETSFNAAELSENGFFPSNVITAASVAAGCSFYSSYNYNANALYSIPSGGTAPLPPHYVVKFANH
jgi:hypothetical protein